jgi:DNA repair exonuclease SbcCD ATPase subunit
MPLTDDELKAQMKAKAEAAIEKLFAEKKRPNEIKLSDIEQTVHEVGEAIKADLTAGLVEQVSEEAETVPGPVCPECGQEMHYKGHKAKQLITETGAVTVKRAYYYCETCRSGLFPPG